MRGSLHDESCIYESLIFFLGRKKTIDFLKIHRPYFSEQFQAHKKFLWKIRSYCIPYLPQGFPCGAGGKESTWQCRRHRRHGFNPWVGKIPWRRRRQPTPVFLPGKFRGQRSLVGYSPWVTKGWTRLSDVAQRSAGPPEKPPE